MLRVRVRIDIQHENSEVLAAALNPDDLSWARCRFEVKEAESSEVGESESLKNYQKEGVLVIDIESRIESVIAAVDDFMINLKAALSVLEALGSA